MIYWYYSRLSAEGNADGALILQRLDEAILQYENPEKWQEQLLAKVVND